MKIQVVFTVILSDLHVEVPGEDAGFVTSDSHFSAVSDFCTVFVSTK